MVLSGCSKNNPAVPPVTDKVNEICLVTYNNKTYTVSITNIAQGVFSECFILPENIKGTVYSFTGEGCDITKDSLCVHTDKSYLDDNALPKRIYNIFREIQSNSEPQYTEEGTEGENSIFIIGDYLVTSNKENGIINRIETADKTIVMQF